MFWTGGGGHRFLQFQPRILNIILRFNYFQRGERFSFCTADSIVSTALFPISRIRLYRLLCNLFNMSSWHLSIFFVRDVLAPRGVYANPTIISRPVGLSGRSCHNNPDLFPTFVCIKRKCSWGFRKTIQEAGSFPQTKTKPSFSWPGATRP